MGIPRGVRAAALIAAAVLLGLLAVQGSYALWNAAVSSSPGSVSAASFTVNLTGTSTGQSTSMTLAGGQSAVLALTGGATVLTPGTSAYAGVLVGNASDAGGPFSISLTAAGASIANVGTGSLAAYLSVNAKTAATTTDCAVPTGYSTSVLTSSLTTAAVPKGGSTVICFQVSLSPSAPAAVKGQSVNITVPVTAQQL
ncbi:hypothetical protein [Arthrobacter sp. NPDC056727]|uniref:hypothetical protein n=1 Tax=Arthrobacter sp. NPDC056727 TaxID=3345927 RepID=UPI00366DD2BD